MSTVASIGLPVGPLGPTPDELAAQSRIADPKAIEGVARNFESLFLSQVLKEMRQTLQPGSLFGKDGGDIYGGMFDMYLGQQLAGSGGFGIAALVKQQLLGGKAHAVHGR